MKYSILTLLSFFQILLFAGDPVEKEISTKINDVTVFIRGAQINRSGEASLASGNTTLKFSGLSPKLLSNSIQVKADNANVTILSVIYQMNYTKEQVKSEEIKALEALRLTWQDKMDRTNKALQILTQDAELLNMNRNFGGQENGVSVEELKAAADFYRARLTEIGNSDLDLRKKLTEIQTEIAKIDKQLYELRAKRDLATSEILVNVSTKTALKSKFSLSYTVNEASWTPTYDLRVESITKPVELTYKANVTQLSGEDWKDVNLTLSTGNPYEGGNKPTLEVWRLGFYAPAYGYAVTTGKVQEAYSDQRAREQLSKPSAPTTSVNNQNAAIPMSTNVGMTSVDFVIETPYNILTDGKNYGVDVKQHSVPALYEYYCAPKLDLSAFLTAKITNWEGYNLLSGKANIYFEGTYLGESYLDVTTLDTLELSLGRDKNIVVIREKKKEFTKKQVLGGNKRDSKAYEISIRNKKTQAINITVEDQLPIPSNNDIKIEDINTADAKHDTESGKLTWKITLTPSTDKKWTFGYTVKYPKDKTLLNYE